MPAPLQPHSFADLWHPELMVGLSELLAAYLLVLFWGQRRLPGARPVPSWQPLLFGLGLLALYAAEGTPLHVVSERYLFSAHMLQHGLLTLFMPPLLMLGIPDWLLQPLLRRYGWLDIAVRRFGQPLPGLLLFNFLYSLYHVPAIYQAGLRSELVHFGQHGVLMLAAFIMWWPVVAPIAAYRMPDGLQVLYLFGQGVAQLLVFAVVTFADQVLYPFYARAPRLFAHIGPRDDQSLAGWVMNTTGLLVFLPALLLAFQRWVRRELARFPIYAQTAPVPAGNESD